MLLSRTTQDTRFRCDAEEQKDRYNEKREQRNISIGGYRKAKLVLAALWKPCRPQNVTQRASPLYFPVFSKLAAHFSHRSAEVQQHEQLVPVGLTCALRLCILGVTELC